MTTSRKVAILMGSANDRPKLAAALDTLNDFGVEATEHVMSAHRTPTRVASFSSEARAAGYGAIICAAGMAAHLAGAVAAQTTLPVIGVPAFGERARRCRCPVLDRADAEGDARSRPSPSMVLSTPPCWRSRSWP